MTLPLSINVYERGPNGRPSTTFVANLAVGADSYTHTITANFGFESMQVSLKATKNEALAWLQDGVLRSVIVYGPEGQVCWEGFVNTVEATFGQEKRTRTLDGMATRVRAKWTNNGGATGTAVIVPNDDAYAIYGRRDLILSNSGLDGDLAYVLSAAKLLQTAYPQSQSTIKAATGSIGDIALTITCSGWYATFDWVIMEPTDRVTALFSKWTTTTYLQNLTTAYNLTNLFFSSDYSGILITGPADDRYIAADSTSYKAKAEELLARGTYNGSANVGVAWGIYEGRKWSVVESALNYPTVITYHRFLGDSAIYNANNVVVEPWDVRPNAMYQVSDFLETGPNASAMDTASRTYIQRTTCSIQGDQAGVDLEPVNSSALELRFPGWG